MIITMRTGKENVHKLRRFVKINTKYVNKGLAMRITRVLSEVRRREEYHPSRSYFPIKHLRNLGKKINNLFNIKRALWKSSHIRKIKLKSF